MANLVKINSVYLYTTKMVDAATSTACDVARTLLTQAGIKFSELWYNDATKDERKAVLSSLSTWKWGHDGAKDSRQMTSFPIVHWTEYYDDWSQHLEHSHGLSELQTSDLLKNASLVEK
jgi:hypothetical protein